MKRVLVAVAACAALGAWGKANDSNRTPPKNDTEFNKFLKANGPIDFEAAQRFIDEQPKPPPKPTLGPINQWRYESCQTDAAKAPTPQGVIQGMRVCREKFNQ